MFSSDVTTVTREEIIPSIADNILKGAPGLLRFLGNSKPWTSGFRLDVPVKYEKSTTGGIVPIGGTLDTSRTTTRIKLQFNPQRLHKPIVVDDLEVAVNQGDRRVVELIAAEAASVGQDLIDDLAGYLYTGTGASGLSFDSLLNAADDSTGFANYGGQAKATYTAIKGYYAASIGALALSDLSTMHDSVAIGVSKPSIYLTTRATFTAYEGLLQAGVQQNVNSQSGYPQLTRTGTVPSTQGLGGDIGFSYLAHRGTPVAADEKCTSQKLFAVNEEHFRYYGINMASVDGYMKMNANDRAVKGPLAFPIPMGYNATEPLRSINQPAEVTHLYFVGNFVSDNPRFLGQLTGITG